MTQYRAYRIAIALLGGGAYIVKDKKEFVVGTGSSWEASGRFARGSTRQEAIARAINRKLGTKFKVAV